MGLAAQGIHAGAALYVLINAAGVPLTDDDIEEAVEMWCEPHTRPEAVGKWGEISNWNVSEVTCMRGLFRCQRDFNEDIQGWDTANVTDMARMLYGASSFNQPLEALNTANVTNMMCMLYGASSFNQPHPS